jgi:hypothetical protein
MQSESAAALRPPISPEQGGPGVKSRFVQRDDDNLQVTATMTLGFASSLAAA